MLKANVSGFRFLRTIVRLLGDTRRLTATIAQGVQLGTANTATADHFDAFDGGAVKREHTFHALAIGNLANGKATVEDFAA